jgi:hypothetical protein
VLNTGCRRKTDIYSWNEQKYPGYFQNVQRTTKTSAWLFGRVQLNTTQIYTSVPVFKKTNAVS